MEQNSHSLDSGKIQGKDTENICVEEVINTSNQEESDSQIIVSEFENFKIKTPEKHLLEIFSEIKSGTYKKEIDVIQNLIKRDAKEIADKRKSNLPAFTTSGTFCDSHSKENLLIYSQVLCLDFDNIPGEELESLRDKVNKCENTFASFVSPSGCGIKVFVLVNSDKEQHTVAYNQVANYYKTLTGCDFDEKCKDISRLCFVSNDPKLHLHVSATIFEVKDEVAELPKLQNSKPTPVLSTETTLDKCLKFTEQKEQYYKGNRNNFIFQFASNANRSGINESDTLDYCITNFNLDEREIKNTVGSVYKNQTAEFANFANTAKKQSDIRTNVIEEVELPNDVLKNTPLISQSVYDNLPSILFESCQVFTNNRERDTFLTGALSILSGCLPNVFGIYNGSEVFPNLYSFVLAPSASGKGTFKFAKALADKYHERVLLQSRKEKELYDDYLKEQKSLKYKGKLDLNPIALPALKFKVVFIPGNTSSAKLIQHLEYNNGNGILCETEADSLGNTLKKEWGSFSDILRKAFHHENISSSKKTDNEFVEVNKAKLSIALSGTPKQIYNIITSAEDGLFSRFYYYIFESDAVWNDQSPKGNPVNLTKFFNSQSGEVLNMVEYFESNKMEFKLTEEQWGKHSSVFTSFLKEISTFVSDDALSVVKRFGLILYRTCMIFTAIRKFSSKSKDEIVYCSDIDFETALALVQVFLQHSILVFTNLPKQSGNAVFKLSNNKKNFFDALPQRFDRKDVIELAKEHFMEIRTMDAFFNACVGNYLTKLKPGLYQKM